MASSTSRYTAAATYQAGLADGRVVTVLVIPSPRSPAPLGYHPRAFGDRLDQLAVRYLDDASGFWRLCDANDAMLPGALEARALIAIPQDGS